MNKISVKNIVTFRNKSEKSQKTFLENLRKKSEIKSEGGGGDYWVRSLSAMSNAVREKNTKPIKEKIADILASIKPDISKQTKDMYERSLSVLHNYEDTAFNDWLPLNSVILNKDSKKAIIEIADVPVQITPAQVYSYDDGNNRYVGAIWFLAKLEGFKNGELGIFAEALQIYLTHNFRTKYQIKPEDCLVVDVLSKEEVDYRMVVDKEIPSLLYPTLERIKKVR
ncbi:hypothetical protein GCM10028822_11710 [Hymenobacter terrigena]